MWLLDVGSRIGSESAELTERAVPNLALRWPEEKPCASCREDCSVDWIESESGKVTVGSFWTAADPFSQAEISCISSRGVCTESQVSLGGGREFSETRSGGLWLCAELELMLPSSLV